jgi:hypothetical protein
VKVCIRLREASFTSLGTDWVEMVWLKTSIGAQKVKTVCIKFRKCCEEEDREG